MLAFVGNRPQDMKHIRHLNGNPLDNRLDNLVYGTPSENAYDRVRHGTFRTRYADKTHCDEGHPYVFSHAKGYRHCPVCVKEREAERCKQSAIRFREFVYNTESEVWLPVVGYEGLYSVSDQGRVRSERRGVVMSPGIRGCTPYIIICVGGKQRQKPISHLVAEAFLGASPATQRISHFNGDSVDNRAENISVSNKRR